MVTVGELLFLVSYCFTALVQRIFNSGEIQNTHLVSDKVAVLNALTYELYTASMKSSVLEKQ